MVVGRGGAPGPRECRERRPAGERIAGVGMGMEEAARHVVVVERPIDRVARHFGAPRPPAGEPLADAGAKLGDPFVGDAAVLLISHVSRVSFQCRVSVVAVR